MTTFEPITGRYATITVEGVDYRIFVEEAGQGQPLLCLHTAGADSRQFRHVLNDAEITRHCRVIAFDMPWHGRSNPPEQWWLNDYKLTRRHYTAMVRAVWRALGLSKPILMGCSMGGAIVLQLAADHQDELGGIIALDSTAFGQARHNDFLHHPAIHGGELVATYTYGLNAPMSPETGKRENWWYYAQGGPGVYAGDVHFYAFDWDAREDIKRIDTTRCSIELLSGEYDYSATPAMTEAVAAAIPGSRYTFMKGMGHFPMVENYSGFRPYLLESLGRIVAGRPR
jgi:pimeloyl-ACP methyl ester carboxylesterase